MKKSLTNMFDSAPVVEVKSAVKKDSKTREVFIGDKLDYLAAINALSDSLQTVKLVYEQEIKTEMMNNFVDESLKQGKRADNFTAVGPNSEANCQMKKRASSSKLSEEEVSLLKEHKISYDVSIVSEEIPEHFFFNPELLSDPSITSKISAKLAEIPELEGKQVIIKQAKREKITKDIVTESSFDEIAKLENRDTVRQLLNIVSSLAIKDKLNTQDISKVLELVKKSGIVL